VHESPLARASDFGRWSGLLRAVPLEEYAVRVTSKFSAPPRVLPSPAVVLFVNVENRPYCAFFSPMSTVDPRPWPPISRFRASISLTSLYPPAKISPLACHFDLGPPPRFAQILPRVHPCVGLFANGNRTIFSWWISTRSFLAVELAPFDPRLRAHLYFKPLCPSSSFSLVVFL